MRTGLWAAAILLWSSTAAEAADWWWIGLNGNAPNRVLTYVDRESIRQLGGGIVEVWLLAVGETPLPNGQQHQANHWAFKCRQRSFSALGRIALDPAWRRLPLADPAPTAYAPLASGSIGESAMNLVCGHPSGSELHVDQPAQHARAYLQNQSGGTEADAAPPGAPQQNRPGPDAPREQAEPAGMSFGTAFFVGPEGFALTAFHVVNGATRIGCRTGDGAVHEAALARMSQANDLALLRVDIRPAHFLGFAPRGSLRPGERVFTIGYGAPNYLGISEPRFSEGAVSALSGLQADNAYVQITVPIQPGNSGGPLVNEAGQVVGIIDSTAGVEDFAQAEGALPQSVNWAIKADYATPLLPPQPPAAPRTRAQAIALTHDAVCLVIAVHGGE